VKHLLYDTIEKFIVDSKAECGQLNLAQARNRKVLKINWNKHQCPFSLVKVRDGSPFNTRTRGEMTCFFLLTTRYITYILFCLKQYKTQEEHFVSWTEMKL